MQILKVYSMCRLELLKVDPLDTSKLYCGGCGYEDPYFHTMSLHLENATQYQVQLQYEKLRRI